jgi:phosphoribosyl 1,2-cyclic phosphodiesterase
MSQPSTFSIRFWGVRGTVPVPGASTLRYGGNTPCVEMRCGSQQLIFDAGTGLRALGRQMIKDCQQCGAHIFLSHTHVDHIHGFAFFKPAYRQGNRLKLWNGHLLRQGRKLEEVVGALMQRPFFPVPFDIMHADISFEDFEAGDSLQPTAAITIRTHFLPHPGGATGYRVEYGGHAACYVTDLEHAEGHLDQDVLRLIDGADVVIYDATFTDEEYVDFHGWGHSTWQEGVRLCKAAGAKRLVTFHHEPDHDDEFMDMVARELDIAMPGSLVAREGLVIDL